MKKLFFTFLFLGVCSLAQAVTITVILTDEEYKAMSVLSVTPEEWVQNAAKNKAKSMIDRIVEDNSDRQASKINEADKKILFDKVDIKKEKEKRHGK